MSVRLNPVTRIGARRPVPVSAAIVASAAVPALTSVAVRAYGFGWAPIAAACGISIATAGYAIITLKASRRELANITEVLGRAAAGDLTVGVDSERVDATELARSTASLLALLRETVTLLIRGSAELFSGTRELRDVSDTMSSTAEATATRAAAVSVAAGQVSASAHRVAAATEEFDATTRDVAAHAAEASTVARGASRQADLTNTTVTELGDASQRVDRIVDLISNIARQTHLLALNATLEAARAG